MDESVIQFMEHETPFTEIIDVNGAEEGMLCDIDFKIHELSYRLEQDSDGDCRVLFIDLQIAAAGKVTYRNEIDILEDIYGIKESLCVAKSVAMLDKPVFDTKTQITINDIASIPAELPEIIQIFNTIAKPYLTAARIENGKIAIEGVIDTYILYLSDDASFPIYTHKHESNFLQYIDSKDLDENMLCDVKIGVEHISYNIGLGREIQLRFILGASVKVISSEEIEYVSEITKGEPLPPADRPKCSLKIYFAQKDDRLWDVAKRYNVTLAGIMAINEIKDKEEIIVGKQIFIPEE